MDLVLTSFNLFDDIKQAEKAVLRMSSSYTLAIEPLLSADK